MTEGLQERREQRGGDAEGEPRQEDRGGGGSFPGCSQSHSGCVSRRHMKTTEPFHLHFVTDDIKETGRKKKKNQTNLFESFANEVYLVG